MFITSIFKWKVNHEQWEKSAIESVRKCQVVEKYRIHRMNDAYEWILIIKVIWNGSYLIIKIKKISKITIKNKCYVFAVHKEM